MGFGLGRKDEAASAPPTPHGRQHGPHESKWAKRALGLSDRLGGAVNQYGQKLGLEAFWPTSGDFPAEMEKAAKILRSFTIEAPAASDAGHHAHKYAKIPPSVVRDAKGIAVYTCVRAGVAPWGGAGGSGLVVARLPDGSWSAPAAIMPTSMTAGIGLDVYDAVLIIRSEEALRQFGSHRFSLGADVSVAAGPRGAGQGAEGTLPSQRKGADGAADKHAQVYSYMRSKGVYAGIEVIGTAFISRTEENELMYHAPGIKPLDILSGRVPSPPAAAGLNLALQAAETGYAQAPGFAQYGPNDTAATVSGGAPPLPARPSAADAYGLDKKGAGAFGQPSGAYGQPSSSAYGQGSSGGYGQEGGGHGFSQGVAAAYGAQQNQAGGEKGGSSAYGQQNTYAQPAQGQSGFAPYRPPSGPPPNQQQQPGEQRFVAPPGPPPPAGPPPAYHE